MKSYRYKNVFLVKRKNKRTVIWKDKKLDEVAYVKLAIFEKGDGHFAMVEENRGIKELTMKLTYETMEVLAYSILEYLKQERR